MSSVSVHALWETHRSVEPEPPNRGEPKYKLRPSFEISGVFSVEVEFMVVPRFTGSDQAE
jgi:hypothetical protein